MFTGKMVFATDRTPLYDAEVTEKLLKTMDDLVSHEVPDAEVSISDNAESDVSYVDGYILVTITATVPDLFFLELCKREIGIDELADRAVESFNLQWDILGEWTELENEHARFTDARDAIEWLADLAEVGTLAKSLETAIDGYVRKESWDKAVAVRVVEAERFVYID